MVDATKPTRRVVRNWLLWWILGSAGLCEQVSRYDSLRVYQSARGISLLLFLASAGLTAAIIELLTHARWGYVDAGIFVVLGFFIYRGRRWAMIAGMVLWTLEKAVQLVPALQGGNLVNPVSALVFWALFMQAMVSAFRVEQARRRQPAVDLAVFD